MNTSTDRPRYNRAARRREVARQARSLLERVAALNPYSMRDDYLCAYCGERERHAPTCVHADVVRFLATHRIPEDRSVES